MLVTILDTTQRLSRHDHQWQDSSLSTGSAAQASRQAAEHSGQAVPQGSLFTTDSIRLDTANRIHIAGSSVAGGGDVSLRADSTVSITSAPGTRTQSYSQQTITRGLMSSGGAGVIIGRQAEKNAADGTLLTNYAGREGSITGSTDIQSGQGIRVHGSDLTAAEDISLRAADIRISAADNRHDTDNRSEFSQGGLKTALSGTAGSAH